MSLDKHSFGDGASHSWCTSPQTSACETTDSLELDALWGPSPLYFRRPAKPQGT